jgi:hypothetical protein
MKNLRTLGAAVVLTLVLGLSTFAGSVETPPCAAPGSVETPPCATQPVADDSTAPRQATTLPVSNADTYSVADVALNVLQIALPLF